MIKNIVFDLGRVLVNYEPKEYLNTFDFTDEIKEELYKIIFASEDWKKYDRGIYLHNTDIAKALCERYPKLCNEVNRVLSSTWPAIHTLKIDTDEYLKELKKKGYKIYILSNLSIDSFNFIQKYDFTKIVDGGVYSYELNIGKPDEGIYKTLLSKYNLIPAETVFIDDALDNVKAANKLGIHGIQFNNIDEVKQVISKL